MDATCAPLLVASPTVDLTPPLACARQHADAALRAARDGQTRRALQYQTVALARLRRTGLPDTCPNVVAVRHVVAASRAVLDGLEVHDTGRFLDATGRSWRPATSGDQMWGGEVFVPDDAPNRYDEHRDALGVMRVDGHAPDDRGDVAVEDALGVLWIPLAVCYLPDQAA